MCVNNNGCEKRMLDLFLGSLILILSLPLMSIISLLVWGSMGRPVFFKQRRPGLGGMVFEVLKFRTMVEAEDGSGKIPPDAERLTKIGRLLRSTSLDELPELFNVVRGDMSLVGPRPLLMRYLNRYTPEQARRHEVKPGVTGWAQVNGRNALTWEEKFKLDVWYVDNQSIWLDLKIIAMTVLKVLKREGISEPGEATMSEFNPQKRRSKMKAQNRPLVKSLIR